MNYEELIENVNRVGFHKKNEGCQFSLSELKSGTSKHLVFDVSFEELEKINVALIDFLNGGFQSRFVNDLELKLNEKDTN